MSGSDSHHPAGAAAPEPALTARARVLSRWLLIAAWATGPAAVYALASLLHAALVERIVTVDVGFGRSLAFWVLSGYLALILWGFLPREPSSRLTRRGIALPMLATGAIGLVVCGGFTLAWLGAHWDPRVGMPVLGALIAILAAAIGTLWIADRTEPTPP